MPTFAIADCPTMLPLAAGMKDGVPVQAGTLVLTVRNTADRQLSARIQVRPQQGAKPAWFAIAGAAATSPLEVEQEFAAKGTRTLTVTVAAEPGDSAAKCLFNVRVTSELDPDNDHVDGPAIAFDVPALQKAPPRRAFPWWAVAVAAGLIVIMVGVVAYLGLRPQLPTEAELVGMKKDAALARLKDGGLGMRQIDVKWGAPKPAGPEVGRISEARYAPDKGSIDLMIVGVAVPGKPNMKLMELRDLLTGAGFKPKVKDDLPPERDIDREHELWRVLRADPEIGGFAEPASEVLLTVGVEVPVYFEGFPDSEVRDVLVRHGIKPKIVNEPQGSRPPGHWDVCKFSVPLPAFLPYGGSIEFYLGRTTPEYSPETSGVAVALRRAMDELKRDGFVPRLSDDSQECAVNPAATVNRQKPNYKESGGCLLLGQEVELSCAPR